MTIKVQVSAQGVRELAVIDEPWHAELGERFRAESCTGLLVGCPGKRGVMGDLDFALELDGLRSVRLLRGIRDISAIFGLRQLEALQLDTVFSGPLNLTALSALRRLETPFVPGIETLPSARHLTDLIVFGWSAGDLSILGEKSTLRFLRVEVKRRTSVSAAGIERAQLLERLNFYEGTLLDPDRLAGLTRLTEVALRNTKIANIEFARKLLRLRFLEMDNVGNVATLRPLDGHPALEVVNLSGSTIIDDGDMNPLLRIPQLRSIGLTRAAANYSHSPRELRKAINK